MKHLNEAQLNRSIELRKQIDESVNNAWDRLTDEVIWSRDEIERLRELLTMAIQAIGPAGEVANLVAKYFPNEFAELREFAKENK